MADDKLKEEQQVELVEKPASTDDFESVDAQSLELDINVDDDASLQAGKVSFAQKVVGDRFEVLDVIGQGGMGSVYKVRDLSTDRIVALKLLKPELCEDKAALKRFQQEAASLAELDHENIVTVYDHGITSDGAPFLIMQYLEGETLADYITKNGKLSPTLAIDLTIQICRGLDYAHKKGFVHRDIKPSNIVLQTDGTGFTIKLLDFGIAKIIESKSAATTNLTQTGDVFGTPAYMSPEQCQGGDIDNRTDIYSLGCVLYEMLTGKQPFAGTNAIQVALKHINGTPDTFTSKLPDGDVLHSLEEIVFKSLKKKPSERFQKIGDILTDLDSVKAGRAVGYVEPEESAPKIKGVPKLLVQLGKHIGNVLFYWTVFILYAVSLTVIYSSDPTQDAYYTTGVTSTLIGTSIFGLAVHGRGMAKAVQNARKRKTLLEWMVALLAVLGFLTYVMFALTACLPDSAIFGNFLSAGVVLCAVLTWSLLVSTVVTGIVVRVKNLVLRAVHWSKNRGNPAAGQYKPSRVPMGPKRAFARIGAMLSVVIVGFVGLYPATTSAFLSTGVFNLLNVTGSNWSVPVLNTAIKLDSRNAHAYRALAFHYEQDGESQMEIDALNQGLKTAPGDPDLLEARGNAYLAEAQYQKAISDFEKKSDQSTAARIGLGQAYLGIGDYDKAYRTFTAAINDSGHSYSSFAEAYSSRALASYAQGNYQTAIEDFSKAIEEDDYADKPLNYVRRGLAYQALGQRTAARHDFETAYRNYGGGDNDEAALAKAFCYIQCNDEPSAAEAMSKATEGGLTKADLKGIVFPNLPSVKLDW